MAKRAEAPPLEEEVLEKKPRHPDATAMLLLSTVFLLGAIGYTWSHIGRYIKGTPEDIAAFEQDISPAENALIVFQRRAEKNDPDIKEALRKARGQTE